LAVVADLAGGCTHPPTPRRARRLGVAEFLWRIDNPVSTLDSMTRARVVGAIRLTYGGSIAAEIRQ
jgi:hypothetical protein